MSWLAAPIPADDAARLTALHELGVLDTEPEESFDAIVRLAASICGVPIALVSLVDEHRQWFKARFGMAAEQTPRDVSYCGRVIEHDETMIVPSAALDPRFADNPLRTGEPNVEFYAGVPLRTASGHNVGTLCVIDHVPRELSEAQQRALEALAVQVTRLLELRRSSAAQRRTIASLRATEASLRRGLHSLPASIHAGPRLRWIFVVACCLALASMLTSSWVQSSLDETGRGRIAQAAQRVEHLLVERIKVYAEITRSVGALYGASDAVSEQEFEAFAQGLELAENYPGLLGIGFVERVERSALARWLPEASREDPDFTLRSNQGGPVLALNRRMSPRAANRAALGFDAFGEAVRRRGLLLASETGDVVMTDRVTLLQDAVHGPGFLLYHAVPGAQRDAPLGWALTVLRVRDLIAGLDDAAGPGIDLRIDDSVREPLLDGSTARPSSLRRAVLQAGHMFTLTLSPGRGFETLSEQVASLTVLLLGVGAALLLALLGRAMENTEQRSRGLARGMTAALRHSENELRAVIDGTSDFVVTFDHDQRLVLVNRAFRETLQCEHAQADGLRLGDVVFDAQRADFEREIARARGEGGTHRIETTFVSRGGARFSVEGTVSTDPDDPAGASQAIFRDVSARKQAEIALLAANAALSQLAATDALTGAANRRLFDERLADECARSVRHGTALALVLIDIDHFKAYNDRYGHAGGDDCLRKVAACIRSHARRSGELAARYGGEEFALILPGSSADEACALAERVRAALAALNIAHERHPLGYVTASFGVAQAEGMVCTPAALIETADAALYRAKAAGRHRVAC